MQYGIATKMRTLLLSLTGAVLLFSIVACGDGNYESVPSVQYIAITPQQLQDFANEETEKYNAYLVNALVAITGTINDMDSGTVWGVNLYGISLNVPNNLILPVICSMDSSTYDKIKRDYKRGDEITLYGEIADMIPVIHQTGVLNCVLSPPGKKTTVALSTFIAQQLGATKEIDVQWVNEAQFEVTYVESYGITFMRKHVVGTVKNVSEETYYTVRIVYNLYDSDGVRIGTTASAYTDSIKPGETWEFEARAIGDTGKASSFTLVSLSARS